MASIAPTHNIKPKSSTAVDRHVGSRTREARLEIGMSQADLARACGITFAQIRQYESGGDRVSASRLWQIAAILEKPIDWFFEGLAVHQLPKTVVKALDTNRRSSLARNEESKIDLDTVRVARSIARLQDKNVKRRVKTMLAALSGIHTAKTYS